MIRIAAVLLTLSASAGMADTISWEAPEATPAGASPAVTGYEVWEKVSGAWEIDQTLGVVYTATVTPEAGNPLGEFAVRALFSAGRTGLSEPVYTDDWLQNLPTPDSGNTVNPGMAQAAIQAMLDGAGPGDVIYFTGGIYSHTANSVYLYAGGSAGTVDGTSGGGYITIMPLPGQTALIQGIGWLEDAATNAAPAQVLLNVSGDYWRVHGMKFSKSGLIAITGYGEFPIIEENEVSEPWADAIRYGERVTPTTGTLNGGIIRYNNLHNSKQGNSAVIRPRSATEYEMSDWRFVRNIGHNNGFHLSDGLIDSYGGGESDSFGSNRAFHDSVNDGTTPVWTHPRGNRALDIHFVQNICFSQADDGIDNLSGDGTLLLGNAMWNNRPSGASTIKSKSDHWGVWKLIGNAAVAPPLTEEPDPVGVMYYNLGSIEIDPGDVITGAISGATATCVTSRQFTSGGGRFEDGDAEGQMTVSGITGTFAPNGESLLVGGVYHAVREVVRMGSYSLRSGEFSVWFENGGTTAIAAGNTVTGTVSGNTATVYFVKVRSGSWAGGNAAGFLQLYSQTGTWVDADAIQVGGVTRAQVYATGGQTGFPISENLVGNGTILRAVGKGLTINGKNNNTQLNAVIGTLSYYNGASDTVPNTASNNHLNTAGAPGIHNTAFYRPDETIAGVLVRDQWRNMYRRFMEQIMPTPGGNLIDAVTLNTTYHHATAADHATTPSDPDDLTKLAWYGSAPDIGASQFTQLWPPVVSVGAASPPAAPVFSAPPLISGSAIEGVTLSSTTGTASGDPAPEYAYQWIRCNAAGASPVDISGAVSAGYTIATGDIGSTIRVRVSATNTEGSDSETSAQTAVVAAYVPPPAGTTSTAGAVSAGALNVGP